MNEKRETLHSYLVLLGYPHIRTRHIARGLICSALDRFSLAGDCHSPYSLGSLCGSCFCSIHFWSASLCP